METFGSTAESHLRKSSTDFSVSMETTDVVKSRADVELELAPAVISFAQFSKLQSSSGFSKTLAQCVGFSDHGGAKAIGVTNSIPSTETVVECQKQGSPSRKEEFQGRISSVSRSTPSLEQEEPKLDIENSSSFGDNWNRETGSVSLVESKHDQSELLFSSPESSKEDSKGNVPIIKEEAEFSVGDFVWSKIKNNLWWPGKIYSSSDASNYALKYKQENHHLVAYFGDGSFSWCSPSQLEHFEDHFDPMSKQSNSKGFVSAVQMALVEVGTRLEMDLSCSCLPFAMNFHPHLTLNAGIKQGTCLDVRRTGKLSVLQYEPSDLLNILKFSAHNSFSDNMFDLTVLKSWLAALYKSKGGHRLPIYTDPLPVLDQLITDRNTLLDVFEFTEISHADGEKEKVFTPVGTMNNQAHELSSTHIHKILDEQLSQRKQKSMVEILGEQGGDVELEHNHNHNHSSESGGDSQDSGPELIPKNRKRSNSSGRFPMRSTSQSKSGRRRRNVGPSVAPRYELLEIESGSSGSEGESTAGIAKDRISHFTNDIQDDDSIQGPRRSTMRQNTEKKKSTSIKAKKKEEVISDRRVKMEDVTQEHQDSMGLESSRKVYLTRERKKSKYLSPPYTTEMDEEDTLLRSPMDPKLSLVRDGVSPPVLIWGSQDVCPQEEHSSGDDKSVIQNRSLTGAEFDLNETRLSSDEALSELQSVAVDFRHSGNQGTLDAVRKFFFMFRCSVYSTHEDGKLIELGFEPESVAPLPLSDDQFHRPSTPQPSPVAEQKLVDVESFTQTHHHSPTPDVLEERDNTQMEQMDVECATGDPISIRHPEMELKPVTEDGITRSGDEMEQTHEVTKAEWTAEEIFTPDEVAEKVGDGVAGQKKKRGRPRGTDGSRQKKQQQQQPGSVSSTSRGRRKEASPCSMLYISFPPAMPLPCKEDLVEMYHKFGVLVDAETDVSHNSYGARVAFEKAEDAERAFNSCREKSPFGEAKASFQLEHPPGVIGESKVRGVQNGNGEKQREWWDAGFIRQKLVMMTSMLEGSDVIPSRDITSSLECEMEGLLHKLRVIIRSYSSSP